MSFSVATSGGSAEIDGVEDLVFHYLDLLDALGLPQVDLVGACLGGWIAAELAVRHSQRIRRLVLMDAPGLHVLLEEAGPLYEVACCLTTEEGFAGQHEAEAAGVPCILHPIRRFCRQRRAALGDLGVRAVYDEETASLLAPFRPDLVLLSSYLFLVTRPMLEAFPWRIVNVHHADLTVTDGGGRPRYVGLRSVRDAIVAGEKETRATAHLVTEKLDDGPPLLRSWPFPVAGLVREALAWGARDMLEAYAFAHQEWMLRAAWGPLLVRSVELLATRRLAIEGRGLTIDGVPGPWELAEDGSVEAGRRIAVAVAN